MSALIFPVRGVDGSCIEATRNHLDHVLVLPRLSPSHFYDPVQNGKRKRKEILVNRAKNIKKYSKMFFSLFLLHQTVKKLEIQNITRKHSVDVSNLSSHAEVKINALVHFF